LGSEPAEAEAVVNRVQGFSSGAILNEADLSDTASPARIFNVVEQSLSTWVLAHCQSVDSDIFTTSIAGRKPCAYRAWLVGFILL
jgi:hypothetical protein